MSGDAGWRSTIPWWYVGGAVFTLVLTVVLADPLNVSSSPVIMWGPMIGMEMRDRRLAARGNVSAPEETEQNRKAVSWRREASFAVLFTSLALGVGILLGFLLSLDDTRPVAGAAAVIGAVLVLIPVFVVGGILVKRRLASRGAASKEEHATRNG